VFAASEVAATRRDSCVAEAAARARIVARSERSSGSAGTSRLAFLIATAMRRIARVGRW
jgi:hypothetical protein